MGAVTLRGESGAPFLRPRTPQTCSASSKSSGLIPPTGGPPSSLRGKEHILFCHAEKWLSFMTCTVAFWTPHAQLHFERLMLFGWGFGWKCSLLLWSKLLHEAGQYNWRYFFSSACRRGCFPATSFIDNERMSSSSRCRSSPLAMFTCRGPSTCWTSSSRGVFAEFNLIPTAHSSHRPIFFIHNVLIIPF